MPTFGSLLKKKRTKDQESKESQTQAESKLHSGSSSGIKTVPTSSSQTASSLSQSDTIKPVATAAAAPSSKDVPVEQAQRQDKQAPQQTFSEVGPTAQSKDVVESQVDGAGSSATMDGRAAHATPRVTKGKYALSDFALQRTLGTGSFGRVHLVQSKHNQRFYAVKVLKKQQVVKMKQVEHTNDERRMLQKVKHPFLVTLWGTFQDSKNLYMVMDFVEGGELFSLLRKSQVSLPPALDDIDQSTMSRKTFKAES